MTKEEIKAISEAASRADRLQDNIRDCEYNVDQIASIMSMLKYSNASHLKVLFYESDESLYGNEAPKTILDLHSRTKECKPEIEYWLNELQKFYIAKIASLSEQIALMPFPVIEENA